MREWVMLHDLLKYNCIKCGSLRSFSDSNKQLLSPLMLSTLDLLSMVPLQRKEILYIQAIPFRSHWCCVNHIGQLRVWRKLKPTEYSIMGRKCISNSGCYLGRQRQVQRGFTLWLLMLYSSITGNIYVYLTCSFI